MAAAIQERENSRGRLNNEASEQFMNNSLNKSNSLGRRGSGSQTRPSPVKQQTAEEIDDEFENLIKKRGSPVKNPKTNEISG